MNEMSLLMFLLSKKGDKYQKGATLEEITNKFDWTPKTSSIKFYTLITNLSHYIEPIGLQISYNTLDSHWFITHQDELEEMISANPFENKPRLAATLFVVLTLCLQNLGRAKIAEVQKLRNKKGIERDLKDLEEFGYLIIDDEKNEVQLTPLIGYQLDLEKVLMNLSLRIKKEKSKQED
ncbi:MAG: hypothetical protein EU550_01345 [Promethearchaeota archaeon]|nr:MAG: hypothetical protein EU550_01345 [Candidatus Lokiarchaeota archaeon]